LQKAGSPYQTSQKVAQLISKRPELDFSKWNARDCKGYLQYYKNETDPKMPSKIAELQAHCCVVHDKKCTPWKAPSPVAADSPSPVAEDSDCSALRMWVSFELLYNNSITSCYH